MPIFTTTMSLLLSTVPATFTYSLTCSQALISFMEEFSSLVKTLYRYQRLMQKYHKHPHYHIILFKVSFFVCVCVGGVSRSWVSIGGIDFYQ